MGALVRADVRRLDPVDLGRGAAVHVLALRERIDQALVAGVVRDDAQLDLRVVGGQQAHALRGHERLANAHALLAADGNVLHVRMRTRRAAPWPRRSG